MNKRRKETKILPPIAGPWPINKIKYGIRTKYLWAIFSTLLFIDQKKYLWTLQTKKEYCPNKNQTLAFLLKNQYFEITSISLSMTSKKRHNGSGCQAIFFTVVWSPNTSQKRVNKLPHHPWLSTSRMHTGTILWTIIFIWGHYLRRGFSILVKLNCEYDILLI